jgi:hypothetical protein
MADDIKPHPGPDPAERFARGIPRGDASLPEAPTSRPRGTRRTNALEDVADRMLVLLDVLQDTNSKVAQILSSQGGGLVNGVLFAGVLPFDVSGVITREHRTMVGSLYIVNTSAGTITVQSGPQSAGAPPQGVGVHLIPAGQVGRVAIGSHAWTIYGVAAALVDVTAFAGLEAFGAIS